MPVGARRPLANMDGWAWAHGSFRRAATVAALPDPSSNGGDARKAAVFMSVAGSATFREQEPDGQGSAAPPDDPQAGAFLLFAILPSRGVHRTDPLRNGEPSTDELVTESSVGRRDW
jgi:hypothetical protein